MLRKLSQFRFTIEGDVHPTTPIMLAVNMHAIKTMFSNIQKLFKNPVVCE